MPENEPRFEESSEELHKAVEAFLTLPSRLQENHEYKNLGKNLGKFLIEKGYVSGVKAWESSWGFKYEDKKIFIADTEISDKNYGYYIFRLGKNEQTGEYLFPKKGDETDQYRFLHEVGHAYQDYLIDKDSFENNIGPSFWYDKASRGEIDSTFSLLFQFCFENRKRDLEKGLSTWGNVPDYDSINNVASQAAIRAIEDANEMINMSLWHPKYLKTFLDYVSLQIPGYTEASLAKDGLIKISPEVRKSLENLLKMYIDEMQFKVEKKD